MLVRMNKILFLALFMLSVNGMAQSTTTQSSFKNRAVSTKNYVINDRQETYSFRGVFTLNKSNDNALATCRIFKDKNGKLHSKYIMECELTHPGVVLEKPIEE